MDALLKRREQLLKEKLEVEERLKRATKKYSINKSIITSLNSTLPCISEDKNEDPPFIIKSLHGALAFFHKRAIYIHSFSTKTYREISVPIRIPTSEINVNVVVTDFYFTKDFNEIVVTNEDGAIFLFLYRENEWSQIQLDKHLNPQLKLIHFVSMSLSSISKYRLVFSSNDTFHVIECSYRDNHVTILTEFRNLLQIVQSSSDPDEFLLIDQKRNMII